MELLSYMNNRIVCPCKVGSIRVVFSAEGYAALYIRLEILTPIIQI